MLLLTVVCLACRPITDWRLDPETAKVLICNTWGLYYRVSSTYHFIITKLKFKLLHSCNQQQGRQRLGNLFNIKYYLQLRSNGFWKKEIKLKKGLITMLTNLNKELAESDSL